MMWKKESAEEDALYVNINELTGVAWNLRFPKLGSTLNKNDEISLQKRTEGNELFRQQQWLPAIKKYNESLCFATEASNEIGLIYANRSACFYYMQQYKECLKDIELATKAGYTEHLMPKLLERKADCLEDAEHGADAMFDAQKLSFEPHEQFPCMANILEFRRNASGYPSVVARGDIAVGKIVMNEKLLHPCTTNDEQVCNVCMKRFANFVPCKRCTAAWFCSEECENAESSIHNYECGLEFPFFITNESAVPWIRQIFIAIKMFASVDELINFVEESIKNDPEEMPIEFLDTKSKYRAFLRLPVPAECFQIPQYAKILYSVYNTFLEIPSLTEIFLVQKYRRFLLHLIVHHFLASIRGWTSNWAVSNVKNMDFACTPNVMVIMSCDSLFVTVIRPIKEGDRLLAFPEFELISQSKEERQQSIRRFTDITCGCSRCLGLSLPLSERCLLQKDTNYRYICESTKSMRFDERVNEIVDNCVSFLNKSGHMMWCEEIERVIELYIMFEHRLCTPYEKSTGKLMFDV